MNKRIAIAVGILAVTLAALSTTACRGRQQPTVAPPPATQSMPEGQNPSATSPSATSAPAAPSSLRAAKVQQTEITLAWQDNSDDEVGFRVYLAGTDVVGRTGQNVTRAVLTDLTCNVQYQYTVRAFNAAGESPPSEPIDVTTAPCP